MNHNLTDNGSIPKAEKRERLDDHQCLIEKDSKKIKRNSNDGSLEEPINKIDTPMNMSQEPIYNNEVEEITYDLNNEYKFQFIWKFSMQKIIKKIRNLISIQPDDKKSHFNYGNEICPDLFHEQQIDQNNKLLIEIKCVEDTKETYQDQ